MKALVYKREGVWICVFGKDRYSVRNADPNGDISLEQALSYFKHRIARNRGKSL